MRKSWNSLTPSERELELSRLLAAEIIPSSSFAANAPAGSLKAREAELLCSTWNSSESSPFIASSYSPATEGLEPIQLFKQRSAAPLTGLPTQKQSNYGIRALQYSRAASDLLKETPSGSLAQREIASLTNDFITAINHRTPAPVINDSELKVYFHDFIVTLANKISVAKNIDYKAAEKQLMAAEKILTWQEGRAVHANISQYSVIDAEGKSRTFKIVRMEASVSTLTDELKQEYLSILEKETKQPKWFKLLSIEMKAEVIGMVTKAQASDDWSKIASIPTALRSVPGLANFACNYFYLYDLTFPETPKLIQSHHTYRCATPPPIDIKDKKESLRLTKLNIQQLINQLLDDYLITNNLSFINIPIEDESSLQRKERILAAKIAAAKNHAQNDRFPIPLNSLLSPLFFEDVSPHKENNGRFLKLIKAAMRELSKEERYKDLDIFVTNTPINALRNLLWMIRGDTTKEDQKYLGYYDKKIASLTKELSATENANTRTLLEMLKAAREGLAELKNSADSFGDKALVRAAYYEIITLCAAACKSGKDRQGFKQEYTVAMLCHYHSCGKFPSRGLPKELGLIGKTLPTLGTAALTAVASIYFTIGSFLSPLTVPVLFGVGLALLLGSMVYYRQHYKITNPSLLTDRNRFKNIFFHLKRTGYNSLSTSMNAPGSYGQKNPGIVSDDMISAARQQSPFKKVAIINIALGSLGASLAFAALHYIAVGVLALHVATPILLPALTFMSVLPIGIFATVMLLKSTYFTIPNLSADKAAASKAFGVNCKEDNELAKINKPHSAAKLSAATRAQMIAALRMRLQALPTVHSAPLLRVMMTSELEPSSGLGHPGLFSRVTGAAGARAADNLSEALSHEEDDAGEGEGLLPKDQQSSGRG